MNPQITVVTVCYNAEGEIENTILSVINQSYHNIEYIIVDGASKDGTMDIVNKYRDKIATIVSEPDKGIYDAMNKGIKLATGDWINFMNAGDSFDNNEVVNNIFCNPETIEHDVIFGKWFLKNNQKLRLQNTFPFYKNESKFRGMGFSHQAAFVPVASARKYMFDLSFKLAADYNMIWKLYYEEHLDFYDCGLPVCIMDETKGATQVGYRLHLEEVCKVCGVTGVYSSLIVAKFVLSHFVKSIIKRLLY